MIPFPSIYEQIKAYMAPPAEVVRQGPVSDKPAAYYQVLGLFIGGLQTIPEIVRASKFNETAVRRAIGKLEMDGRIVFIGYREGTKKKQWKVAE